MQKPGLVDDCFAHAEHLISHDDAIEHLRQRIAPVTQAIDIPLADTAGRIVFSPITAPNDVPAHANAAVDGYGFAFADYDAGNGTALPVSGRAAAGRAVTGKVKTGAAVRIFTGAPVPDGIDSVVMQEDVKTAAGEGRITATIVHLPAGLKMGANVRPAGEDVKAGETLFETGHTLRPQDLAALASIGCAMVRCHRPLRVAVVSTGDEVVPASSGQLKPGQVFDANTPMLSQLATRAGCEVTTLGIWKDDPGFIRDNLNKAAQDFDVILTSGGASQGEEDHLAATLTAIGHRHFWQIAVKPGRPIMFGQVDAVPVIGLPGNPVAVFVCFLMYVYPVLRRLAGADWPTPRRFLLPAAFSVPRRKLGRREFWRARTVSRETGLAVEKFPRDGSGLISGLRFANGLVDVAEDTPSIEQGQQVAFIPFSDFGILD